MNSKDLIREINLLKRERNAVILAHNYQLPEIQDLGDYTGDSLELSRLAAKTDKDIIVFCGVYFMAETAKILSPSKKVLVPDPEAGCPMADMIRAEDVMKLREQHPLAAVCCYVNSSASVKAVSDICCTSGNAVKVVESIKTEDIIFIPDMNLGDYVRKKTGRNIILFDGFCPTHHRLMPEEVITAKNINPGALFICHPECNPEVVSLADEVASTSGMLKFVKESPKLKFLIGTERELIYRMKKENPQKEFILVSDKLLCPNMKKNTQEKLYAALKTGNNEVTVESSIVEKARRSLERMIQI